MISLSIYLVFLGFWVCYQTSKRAVLTSPTQIELLVRNHSMSASATGLVLLMVGLMVSLMTFGFGSGIFSYLLMVCVVASLVIILAPLGWLSLKKATILGFVFLAFELSLNAS